MYNFKLKIVKFHYEGTNGKEFIFSELKEGDIFGDYNFITG